MEKTTSKINMDMFREYPGRYQLRKGYEEVAPACPFGNNYEWIGFDTKEQRYVRFTKSVFKLLIEELEL